MASDIIYRYVGAPEPPAPEPPAEGQEDAPQPFRAERPHLPGVPLRDLTKQDVDGLPSWLQEAVSKSDLYQSAQPEPAPSRRSRATPTEE